MIRVETALGTGIKVHQQSQLTHQVLRLDEGMRKEHPDAHPRTDPSVTYNCHGLTFASRRGWIFRNVDISTILKEDRYAEIPHWHHVLPGDVVVYYSEQGEPNHSGVIVGDGPPLIIPWVYSKWANIGEYVHRLNDHPLGWGPLHRFYRCRR